MASLKPETNGRSMYLLVGLMTVTTLFNAALAFTEKPADRVERKVTELAPQVTAAGNAVAAHGARLNAHDTRLTTLERRQERIERMLLDILAEVKKD